MDFDVIAFFNFWVFYATKSFCGRIDEIVRLELARFVELKRILKIIELNMTFRIE